MTTSPMVAEFRWVVHHREREASESLRSAYQTRQRAMALSRTMIELREVARARRAALESERARVAAGAARVREHADRVLGEPACVQSGLGLAREMAGLTITDLWCAYIGLGGDLSPEPFAEMLAADRPVPRRDYIVIALALNEHFAEAGFGRPIPPDPPSVIRRSAAPR